MAASSASLAAAKLLNLRNPAAQYLIRRQLLHLGAAAAASSSFHLPEPTFNSPTFTDAQSFKLIQPETGSTKHELNARNWGIHASNFHQYLQLPSGPCPLPAYRTYASRYPKDDAYEDYDDDDDDDDDDGDDEGDIQDYSGSDFDDDNDDSDAHPRSGRYRN